MRPITRGFANRVATPLSPHRAGLDSRTMRRSTSGQRRKIEEAKRVVQQALDDAVRRIDGGVVLKRRGS